MKGGQDKKRTGQRKGLRLEDVIAMQGEDEAPVDLYEAASEPLMPRSAQAPRVGLVHLGVDTSSRALAAPAADVVIAALSVSGPGPVELCDRPSVYPGVDCGEGPPYIYVVPHGEVDVQSSDSVQVVYPDDGELSPAYLLGLMNYARLTLESWAMEGPMRRLASIYLGLGRRPVVLLDGPIFIAQGKGVTEQMRLRYKAVKALESEGVPVIGVVKRVERSTLLASSTNFARLASSWEVEVSGSTDSMIIQQLSRSRSVRVLPGTVYVTPRILVRGSGLEKVIEYVVVPPGPWRGPASRSRVYRLEYTEDTLRLFSRLGLDPLRAFLADSLRRQSLASVTVSESDRRSKMITATLKELLAKEIVGLGGRLGYETEVEELVEGSAWWPKG